MADVQGFSCGVVGGGGFGVGIQHAALLELNDVIFCLCDWYV